MTVSIIDADFSVAEHAAGLIAVLNEYAQLPVMTGKTLDEDLQKRLPGLLAETLGAHVLLAVNEEKVAGAAVCFLGFSTFAGKPLLNVHDLAVSSEFRNLGIGGALLDGVAEKALSLGCCRVTLEVDNENDEARGSNRPRGGGGPRGLGDRRRQRCGGRSRRLCGCHHPQ